MGTVIECKNISRKYNKKTAVDDVSFKIEAGRIIGLLGLNGCGKTTLLKIIAGLDSTYEGELEIPGVDIVREDSADNGIGGKVTDSKQTSDKLIRIDKNNRDKLRTIVSYCPDKMEYNKESTIEAIIDFYETFFENFNRDKADKAFADEKIDTSERIGKLSKGIVEKVKVILTMSREAKLYILDEPLDGIDVVARDSIIKMMISYMCEDASMLISSHNIADIENIIDETIFIKDGRVVLNKAVDELREESGKSIVDLFKEYFK